jgi:hypothetical protein
MPLPKQVDEDDRDDEHSVVWPFAAGVAEYGRLVLGFATELMPRAFGSASSAPAEVPRVGKYYADYSELKPEEIANVDAECADLFKRSKPVSR